MGVGQRAQTVARMGKLRGGPRLGGKTLVSLLSGGVRPMLWRCSKHVLSDVRGGTSLPFSSDSSISDRMLDPEIIETDNQNKGRSHSCG